MYLTYFYCRTNIVLQRITTFLLLNKGTLSPILEKVVIKDLNKKDIKISLNMHTGYIIISIDAEGLDLFGRAV